MKFVQNIEFIFNFVIGNVSDSSTFNFCVPAHVLWNEVNWNMAAGGDDFDSWLSLKLLNLNTDEGVFGSYIKGILDGDESLEDKTEALEEILSEITVNKHIS